MRLWTSQICKWTVVNAARLDDPRQMTCVKLVGPREHGPPSHCNDERSAKLVPATLLCSALSYAIKQSRPTRSVRGMTAFWSFEIQALGRRWAAPKSAAREAISALPTASPPPPSEESLRLYPSGRMGNPQIAETAANIPSRKRSGVIAVLMTDQNAC